MGLKTTKNFVTANAVEAILQVPTVSYSTEPDYLKKADYAKVPARVGGADVAPTNRGDAAAATVRVLR